MPGSSDLAKYRRMVERHTRELESWIAADPANSRRFMEHGAGDGRTLRQYLAEYSDHFALVAHLANDLDYPRADEMLDEYGCFSQELQDRFAN
jgi:hypothetical protein